MKCIPRFDDSIYARCEQALRAGEHEAAVSLCESAWSRTHTRKGELLSAASLIGAGRMDEGEQRYNGYGILGWLNDLSSRRTLKTVNGAIKHNRYQLRMVEDLLDTDDRLIGIWTAKGRLYASRSQIFSFVPDSEDVMELNRQLAHESYETALRLTKPNDSKARQGRDRLCESWNGC